MTYQIKTIMCNYKNATACKKIRMMRTRGNFCIEKHLVQVWRRWQFAHIWNKPNNINIQQKSPSDQTITNKAMAHHKLHPCTPCIRTHQVLAPAVVQDRTQPTPHSRGVRTYPKLQWGCCCGSNMPP